MADKGNTYYCSWKHESDGTCVGWEIRRPKLRAEASSPIELMPNLGDVVGEYYNDHEAALHFDPPLFKTGEKEWFVDGLMEIAWNSRFHFRPSAETAYADGRCNCCGGGLGRRTEVPLSIDEIDDATDGAASPLSNEPPPCYGNPGSLTIVSEAFLNGLTDAERKTFDARPIKSTKTSRRRFFELIPHAYVALGAIKGLEVDGWRCEQCDRHVYGHGSILGYGVEVACRQSLPVTSKDFFFAGSDTDVHLYCTHQRWKSLVGKKWTRKLTGDRLAVVDQSKFQVNPMLGTLEEIADFRRIHGFKVPFRPRSSN